MTFAKWKMNYSTTCTVSDFYLFLSFLDPLSPSKRDEKQKQIQHQLLGYWFEEKGPLKILNDPKLIINGFKLAPWSCRVNFVSCRTFRGHLAISQTGIWSGTILGRTLRFLYMYRSYMCFDLYFLGQPVRLFVNKWKKIFQLVCIIERMV